MQYGPKLPIEEMEDPWKYNQADRTQSAKNTEFLTEFCGDPLEM